MKNTSNHETTWSLPSLRVVFKKTQFQEENDHISENAHLSAERKPAANQQNHLPMFDDYKFKAKDHDPL